MDELKSIFNTVGWGGFAFYILVKYGHLWWKKFNGKYVSWKDLDVRIGKIEDRIPIIDQHLKDSTSRVVDLETLKKDNQLNNEFTREGIKELKEDVKNIYGMLSDIKTMMIQQRGN